MTRALITASCCSNLSDSWKTTEVGVRGSISWFAPASPFGTMTLQFVNKEHTAAAAQSVGINTLSARFAAEKYLALEIRDALKKIAQQTHRTRRSRFIAGLAPPYESESLPTIHDPNPISTPSHISPNVHTAHHDRSRNVSSALPPLPSPV